MRYVALIALINFLLLTAVSLALSKGATDVPSALLFSGFVCAFGVPLGIVTGIPMLWTARRLATGSVIPLAILGSLAGALVPIIMIWKVEGQAEIIALGSVLGLVSAIQWWFFVERFPDRRTYYD